MAETVEGSDQPDNGLDAFMSKIGADMDKRFQGFQGTLDRRDSEYRQMLEDLKTADLPPEEREQAQTSRLQQELESYKRKVEILSMRKQFPEEVDLLSNLLEGKSLQDQLALLSNFRKVEAASDSPEEEVEEQPTPVDKNNPKRRPRLSSADFTGKNMSKELSEQILAESGNKPGLMRILRGG